MKHFLLLAAVCALSRDILAQSPTPAASAPVPACTAPEFRQFDFWLGKWTVTNPRNGNQAGTSEIVRASEGCAICERWTASNGTTGMSINYYDASEHAWHQDWVGGDGTILHLRGGLDGNAMVVRGETKTAKGTTMNRITWTPQAADKVRQEWAISTDGGRSWQISFVGIYTRR